MTEYTLIIRDIMSGNKEVEVHSILLSGIYEQYPKDFFESKVEGSVNRETLRRNLQEKLHRPEISTDILEYIITQWCQGIKEHYKRRFVLPLELLYTQPRVVPRSPTYKNVKQHPSVTSLPTNVRDVKTADSIHPVTTNKQELDQQNAKSGTPPQTVPEPQIRSRAATDAWSD
ncbi:hypothetical protein G7B40_000295 [Aetokthonos hydrillicola Thurmond2011]|jgi:hypothetical protein|uniref:Uncharacterized protein n=1 Tax=Aetokthonos hydrillicola Thurmond2011 TaxID=2712845 RepID=A0AAP5I5T3_9CYAN|nr:hypothetical protein [Aetokthonos hydrillicola]MBO3460168.1 hypothetical protein [Aetokthonos hydrillicola CCALA 1050]MBW4590566.1 hypothetical protein [Aetokthonos hydrillicola CCALA 1050]MDR9893025.1 hypothetical protein [Aetokthonos hydrillicola Thurmond2011]